jgi:hypothetical protein
MTKKVKTIEASKNGARARKASAAKAGAAKAATVDFPREDEVIVSSDYTFRVDAPGAWSVELSVNGGDWQPCREAVGYWWFDWKASPGSHEITARARKANGRPAKSQPRRFSVELI